MGAIAVGPGHITLTVVPVGIPMNSCQVDVAGA